MCKDLAWKKTKIALIVLPNIENLTLAAIAKRTSNHNRMTPQIIASLSFFWSKTPIKSHKKGEEETQSKFL